MTCQWRNTFWCLNRGNSVFLAGVIGVTLLSGGCLTGGPEPNLVQHRQSYSCPRTSVAPTIDGCFDEPAWRRAEIVREFSIPVSTEVPVQRTVARIMWDAINLYIVFKTTDQDIWGLLTSHDALTCREDVCEIFFKTDPEAEGYYNFEINALGTVMDAYHYRVKAGMGHRWKNWNCEGIKTGVKLAGTINNWEDCDEYWQLEVAIPFAALPSLKGKAPQSGDVWLFHLARYDHSVYLEKGRELASCAALTKCSFHFWEDWLPLHFIGR